MDSQAVTYNKYMSIPMEKIKYEILETNEDPKSYAFCASQIFKNCIYYLQRYFKPDTTVRFSNMLGEHLDLEKVPHLIDSNMLDIVSWGYVNSKNSIINESILNVFENLNLRVSPIFIPLDNEDEEVFYYDGVAFAVFNKRYNIIWLLWDALCSVALNFKNSCGMIVKIVEYFSKMFNDNNIFEYPSSSDRAMPCKILNNIVFDTKKLSDLKLSLKEHEQKIIEKQSQLAHLNNKRLSINEAIDALECQKPMETEILNKYVKHIQYRDGLLEIFTDHIFITEFDFERFRYQFDDYDDEFLSKCGWYIGHFYITVDIEDKMRVTFKNLNNRRVSFWADEHEDDDIYDMHPHISHSGIGCFGNLAEMVSFAMSKSDITILIDVIIQFLQSVNLEDCAGRYVKNWDFIDMKENKYLLPTNRAGEDFKLKEIDLELIPESNLSIGEWIHENYVNR